MKYLLSAFFLICTSLQIFAQNIGIGTPTPDASALLDITSTDKGLLIPRVALASAFDASTIPNPASSLLVFNSGTGGLSPAGYYYNNGTSGSPFWVQLIISGSAWNSAGNAGTVAGTNFLGTTDDVPLSFRVFNQPAGKIETNLTYNIFMGLQSGNASSFGIGNSGFGGLALGNISTGQDNVALGTSALFYNTSGNKNTGIGGLSLFSNVGKEGNTAVGYLALGFSNSSAVPGLTNNTAVGINALRGSLSPQDNTGTENTSIGASSMLNNTSGSNNAVLGSGSLISNTTGSNNTASGAGSLSLNTTGGHNTAHGYFSLNRNVANNGSTAIGAFAMLYAHNSLSSNTTYNTAVGYEALRGSVTPENNSGTHNTALGHASMLNNTSGNNNVAIGFNALYNNRTGVTNTAIGSLSLENNVSKTGNTAVGYSAMRYADNAVSGVNSANTALGSFALFGSLISSNNTGTSNTAIGANSMLNTSSGSNNTVLGVNALNNNSTGSNNTAIGKEALLTSSGSSGNVGLGYQAGANENTSNKLYIENSNANKDNALIYGDFEADSLLLNAKTINKFSLNVRGNNFLEIGYGTAAKQTDAGKLCYGCFGDPAHWLGIVGGGQQVNNGSDRVIKLWTEGGLRVKGNALPDINNFYTLGTSAQRWKELWINQSAINTSDANLKTNIEGSPYGLDEVMQMNPVEYNWKDNPFEDKQIGFLAQDILKIIPEAVVVPNNGDPLGMKYDELIPVLVKAIQEQQLQIEELKKSLLKSEK